MKTLKLLILTLFLSLTTFTNAQDASNDATWEETIEFIGSNLSPKILPSQRFWFTHDGYFHQVKQIYISNDVLVVSGEFVIDSRGLENKTIKIPLIKLKMTGDHINILCSLTSSDIKFIYDGQNWAFKDFSFGIDDSELEPRVYKAFKHLAYLATKKREEERKASGNKF
jgi:hypothetical protein